jgi:hypothetical protein
VFSQRHVLGEEGGLALQILDIPAPVSHPPHSSSLGKAKGKKTYATEYNFFLPVSGNTHSLWCLEQYRQGLMPEHLIFRYRHALQLRRTPGQNHRNHLRRAGRG